MQQPDLFTQDDVVPSDQTVLSFPIVEEDDKVEFNTSPRVPLTSNPADYRRWAQSQAIDLSQFTSIEFKNLIQNGFNVEDPNDSNSVVTAKLFSSTDADGQIPRVKLSEISPGVGTVKVSERVRSTKGKISGKKALTITMEYVPDMLLTHCRPVWGIQELNPQFNGVTRSQYHQAYVVSSSSSSAVTELRSSEDVGSSFQSKVIANVSTGVYLSTNRYFGTNATSPGAGDYFNFVTQFLGRPGLSPLHSKIYLPKDVEKYPAAEDFEQSLFDTRQRYNRVLNNCGFNSFNSVERKNQPACSADDIDKLVETSLGGQASSTLIEIYSAFDNVYRRIYDSYVNFENVYQNLEAQNQNAAMWAADKAVTPVGKTNYAADVSNRFENSVYGAYFGSYASTNNSQWTFVDNGNISSTGNKRQGYGSRYRGGAEEFYRLRPEDNVLSYYADPGRGLCSTQYDAGNNPYEQNNRNFTTAFDITRGNPVFESCQVLEFMGTVTFDRRDGENIISRMVTPFSTPLVLTGITDLNEKYASLAEKYVEYDEQVEDGQALRQEQALQLAPYQTLELEATIFLEVFEDEYRKVLKYDKELLLPEDERDPSITKPQVYPETDEERAVLQGIAREFEDAYGVNFESEGLSTGAWVAIGVFSAIVVVIIITLIVVYTRKSKNKK